MAATRQWYSVKLLFTYVLAVEPDRARVDALFESDVRAYEESVVLVEAHSFEQAYELAELGAQQREQVYENQYGQQVLVRLYEALDCYLLDVEPGQELVHELEVYSAIRQGKASQDIPSFIAQTYPRHAGRHSMFLNRKFNG